MGVKSYVAGMQADAVDNAVGAVFNIGSIGAAEYKKAKDGKDKTDITVETARIDAQSADFLDGLKFDRAWERYEDKVDESFADIISNIENNELLSDRARDALLNDVIPQKREQALGKARIIGYNTQMTEIEVGIERRGDLLANDPDRDLSSAVGSFEEYVTDLGVYNEETIAKMVAEFEYSTAPIKALQQFTTEYEDKYKEEGFSPNELLSQAEKGFELDIAQKRAMRKEALAFQKNFDDAIDANAKETFQVQYGELAQARDRNELVDADQYDALADEVPARFKSEVMKLKNTARSNNDDIITGQIQKTINTGAPFTSDDWVAIESVYDPEVKNILVKDVLVSEGRKHIEAGDLQGAIANLYTYNTSRVNEGNIRDAKGQLIQDYMAIQNDAQSVAKALVDWSGYKPAKPSPTPEFTATVDSAVKDAPPIDTIKVDEEGESYVSEQVVEVAKAIQEKSGVTEEEANNIAEAVVTKQLEEAGYKVITESPEENVVPVEEANIDVSSLPIVDNGDGTVSTVDSISISEDEVEVLIPTVVDGKKVSYEEAVAHYHETGEHLGKFKTVAEANSAATALHNKEELRVSQELEKPKIEPNVFSEDVQRGIDKAEDFQNDLAGLRQAELNVKMEEAAKRTTYLGKDKDGKTIGVEKPDFSAGGNQETIMASILEFINDGNGRFVTEEDLSLILNSEIRDDFRKWANDWQHKVIDDPTTLYWMEDMRYDPSVDVSIQKQIAATLYNKGLLRAETADRFATKSPLANNERYQEILGRGYDLAKDLYPDDSDKAMGYVWKYRELVQRAIMNDPSLADPDKGFNKLRTLVNEFTVDTYTQGHMERLENLNDLYKDGQLKDILKTLEDTDQNTFMYEVGQGTYDMFINPVKVQKPEMLLLKARDNSNIRNLSQTMDAVTKEITNGGYTKYADLVEKGTDLEKLEVLINANFIISAGVYEKGLMGSFGVSTSGMKVIGNNWAYQDRDNPDIWFSPVFDEVYHKDKQGWKLLLMEDGKVTNIMEPKEYVDPTLLYDVQKLSEKVNSEAYAKAYERALDPLTSRPSGFDMRKINMDREKAELKDLEQELADQIRKAIDDRKHLLLLGAGQ